MMIRTDGEYKIYIVKHYHEGSWGKSNLDHFFVHDTNGKLTKENKDFTANGECWQRTGISGTFNKDIAIAFKNQLEQKYTDKQFGVFEILISQKQTLVS